MKKLLFFAFLLFSLPALAQEGDSLQMQIESYYPNPAASEITANILSEDANTISISIYSTLGQKVYYLPNQRIEDGETRLTISLKTFPSGLYFINLTKGERRYEDKIMIVR